MLKKRQRSSASWRWQKAMDDMDKDQLRQLLPFRPEQIRSALDALSSSRINGQRVSEFEIHEGMVSDRWDDAWTEVTYTLEDKSQVTIAFRRLR